MTRKLEKKIKNGKFFSNFLIKPCEKVTMIRSYQRDWTFYKKVIHQIEYKNTKTKGDGLWHSFSLTSRIQPFLCTGVTFGGYWDISLPLMKKTKNKNILVGYSIVFQWYHHSPRSQGHQTTIKNSIIRIFCLCLSHGPLVLL